MPEEMIGVIPNSIRVPRLLASIIRSQYRGSEVSEETMPYKGIWLMTRKIIRVNPVHINFWLKGTLVSGAATSGRRGVKGLIRSRKRSPLMMTDPPPSPRD
jgi:hypothetical protein